MQAEADSWPYSQCTGDAVGSSQLMQESNPFSVNRIKSLSYPIHLLYTHSRSLVYDDIFSVSHNAGFAITAIYYIAN